MRREALDCSISVARLAHGTSQPASFVLQCNRARISSYICPFSSLDQSCADRRQRPVHLLAICILSFLLPASTSDFCAICAEPRFFIPQSGCGRCQRHAPAAGGRGGGHGQEIHQALLGPAADSAAVHAGLVPAQPPSDHQVSLITHPCSLTSATRCLYITLTSHCSPVLE